MTYYVVYPYDESPVVLEAFLSKEIARQYTQTMASWFEYPLQILDSPRGGVKSRGG